MNFVSYENAKELFSRVLSKLTKHISDVNLHIPSGGNKNQILRCSADGTAVWGNESTSSGGQEHISLTKAEYDAMESAGTLDPNVIYITTDEVDNITDSDIENWNNKMSSDSDGSNLTVTMVSDDESTVLDTTMTVKRFFTRVKNTLVGLQSLCEQMGENITALQDGLTSCNSDLTNLSEKATKFISLNDTTCDTMFYKIGAIKVSNGKYILHIYDSTNTWLGNIISDSTSSYYMHGGTEILENANLNNYSNPGNYYCQSNAKATTLTNTPTFSAFTLKVEYSVGTSYPCQTIRVYNTGYLYYRYYDSYASTWRNWRVITCAEVS